MEGDYLLPRFAESLYGVVSGDPEATACRRAAMREERAGRAVPVREWMAAERRRVLDGDLIEPVKRMYAESLRLGDRWAREFREFWDLPEDFDYDIDTPEVDLAKQLLAQEPGA